MGYTVTAVILPNCWLFT